MIKLIINIVTWVKGHIYELFAGSTGFISTIAVDWNHIAERAIETFIIAIVNGAGAAAAGWLVVWTLKKIFKKDVRNINRNTNGPGRPSNS